MFHNAHHNMQHQEYYMNMFMNGGNGKKVSTLRNHLLKKLSKQLKRSIKNHYKIPPLIQSPKRYQIFSSIFKKIVAIDSEQLSTEERTARNMFYNLQDPLVTLYEGTKELECLGEAADNPYTLKHFTSFLIEVKKRQFEDGIRAWNKK